jgi:hypothetical protein
MAGMQRIPQGQKKQLHESMGRQTGLDSVVVIVVVVVVVVAGSLARTA